MTSKVIALPETCIEHSVGPRACLESARRGGLTLDVAKRLEVRGHVLVELDGRGRDGILDG